MNDIQQGYYLQQGYFPFPQKFLQLIGIYRSKNFKTVYTLPTSFPFVKIYDRIFAAHKIFSSYITDSLTSFLIYLIIIFLWTALVLFYYNCWITLRSLFNSQSFKSCWNECEINFLRSIITYEKYSTRFQLLSMFENYYVPHTVHKY